MSMFFNIGSFTLGMIAVCLPMVALLQKARRNRASGLCILSLGSCATALLLQLFELKNRVVLEDWTAIMDTIGLVCWMAVLLTVMTVILNMAALKKQARA